MKCDEKIVPGYKTPIGPHFVTSNQVHTNYEDEVEMETDLTNLEVNEPLLSLPAPAEVHSNIEEIEASQFHDYVVENDVEY